MTEISGTEWAQFTSNFPDVHILQTRTWGDLKSLFGWEVVRIRQETAGAQILFKKMPLGLKIGYIPKGPVGREWKTLWSEIDLACKQRNTVMLKVEPDGWEEQKEAPDLIVPILGENAATIQPRRTILVNLEGNQDIWLNRMKQKTRYNIRLAERKNVVVRPWGDVGKFHEMMLVTGKRDGFGVHSLQYYQTAYRLFSAMNACELLVAEYEGTPLAALMVFAWGRRSWYFYGSSNDLERSRMPTYLLQWKAMDWAKQKGCEEYDLWGIPDYDENFLEDNFETRSDGLWGVYRFKRGFGGLIRRSAGAWNRVYQPKIYRVYRWWMKRGADGG